MRSRRHRVANRQVARTRTPHKKQRLRSPAPALVPTHHTQESPHTPKKRTKHKSPQRSKQPRRESPTAPVKPKQLKLADAVPHNLPLAQRSVLRHFVDLTSQDVWTSDTLRQQLFAIAPRQLFVFPKRTLNRSQATLVMRVGPKAGLPRRPGYPTLFPNRAEPLLVFENNLYLAVDGSVFELPVKHLTENLEGSPRLPVAARNKGLALRYAIYAARREGTKKEHRIATQLLQGKARENSCRKRLWAQTQRKIASLKKRPGNDDRIEQLLEEADMREASHCSEQREETDAKLWDQLINLRTQRRNKAMHPLKKRLETLFVGY